MSCGNLTIDGTITAGDNTTSCDAGPPQITLSLADAMTINSPVNSYYTLSDATETSVSFSGITNAHFVFIRAVGDKIRVRLTSTDGSAQSVPVEGLLLLVNRQVPITAITVTRITGSTVDVKVYVTLGEIPA